MEALNQNQSRGRQDYLNVIHTGLFEPSKISLARSAFLVPRFLMESPVCGLNPLSWPADHTGWRLQAQTNALNNGLGTNWAGVEAATATNQVTLPISTTNGSVFFRLVYP